MIKENMLSMQTKKSSSEQMCWILVKTSNTAKYIRNIYVIKWNFFIRGNIGEFFNDFQFQKPRKTV